VTGGVNAQKLLEHNSDEFFSKQSEFPHSKNLEENPIIIDLGQTRLINFILLVLFDNIRNERRGNHSFSYYVETSIERENNYFRVIDHSKFICRSKQKIYFYPREVRYIKIVGISSYLDINLDANNDHLFLCSFHCQLTDEPFDISRGIWAPDRRITDYNEKCLLAYGQNKPEVVIPWMLSPDCVESNYSFHKRHKKKYLLVQLTQPVFVNRIDMRLIGNDYNFTIERLDFNSNRNVFQMIMNEENYSNDYIEHILIHFLKIHGSSILNDEFKCGDLCCP
jgi:BTB/POZ domain-containing protein 9